MKVRSFLFGSVVACVAGVVADSTVVVRLPGEGAALSYDTRENTIYRAVTTGSAGWVNFDYSFDNCASGDPIANATGAVTPGYAQLVFSIDGEVVCSNRIDTATSEDSSLDADRAFIPSGTHVLLWEVKAQPSSAPGTIWEGEGEDRKEADGTVYGEAPTVTIKNLTYGRGDVDAESDYLVVSTSYGVLNDPCLLGLGQQVDETVGAYFKVFSESLATVTATSLPPGLYVRQRKTGPEAGDWYLTGTPTKEGVYYTTFKASNANGYSFTAYLRFDVGGREPVFTNTAKIDLSGLIESPASVAEEFSQCLEIPAAANGAPVSSVKVTGLPAGVKAVFQEARGETPARVTLSGTPTAPSLSTLTLVVNYATTKKKSRGKTITVKTAAAKTTGKFLVADAGSAHVGLEVAGGESVDGAPGGVVTGGGVKRIGSTITVTAKPVDAAKTVFVGWFVKDGDEFVPCNQAIEGWDGDYRKVVDYRTPSIAFMVRSGCMQQLYARFENLENAAVEMSGGISCSLTAAQCPELAAPAGWTLRAVKGLPAGLSLKNGQIQGTATEPGYKTVTLTYTKGKTSYTRTAVIYVEPLPLWVQGTFTGGVMLDTTLKIGNTTTQNGTFAATVTAGGKVSGSYNINGTKVAFSGTGLTVREEGDGQLAYQAKVSGKVAGKTKTFFFTIAQAASQATVSKPVVKFRGALSVAQDLHELIIRQNVWIRSDAANLGLPTFIGTPVYTPKMDGKYGLMLKFGAKGAVTGTITGDKAAISFSSTLIDVEPTADGCRAKLVIATFADAKKKTKAHDFVVELNLGSQEIEMTEVDEEGNETPTTVFGLTSESIGAEVFNFATYEGMLAE